ncbi:MAG: DUF3800 domain-containing protein [Candidatus Sulfotelmatobacter sp.]
MDFVFDDSGGYKESEFICIAGYVSSSEKFGALSDDWLALLIRHKLPYIHMRTFVPMQKPYKDLGWDASKRDVVLLEFIELIRKHTIAGFAVALDARYYRAMPKDTSRILGNPHAFCVARLIRLIRATLMGAGAEEPNTLIFDDAEEFSVMYHGVVRDLRKLPEYRKILASVCFADDEVYNPLQAADILAWESTKQLSQQAGGFKPRPEFSQLIALDDPNVLPYISELYGQVALDDAYKKGKQREGG